LAVSDEILFMSNGQIIERGRPEEIYFRPKKRLTAEFLGEANFLTGDIMGTEQDYLVVQTPGGKIACSKTKSCGLGARVTVFFRPEDVEIVREKPAHRFPLSGVISETVFLGKMAECLVDLAGGNQLKVSVHARFNPKRGEPVHLSIDPAVCAILDE
jgi:ABC-type Fe3+/spermidine/putrescine transport system ATPase subunit